jgi:hypothetical protein
MLRLRLLPDLRSSGTQHLKSCRELYEVFHFNPRTLSEYPLSAQDRQQENVGTTNHSEESPIESSFDTNSAIGKNTVSSDSVVVSVLVRYVQSANNESPPAHTRNRLTPVEAIGATYSGSPRRLPRLFAWSMFSSRMSIQAGSTTNGISPWLPGVGEHNASAFTRQGERFVIKQRSFGPPGATTTGGKCFLFPAILGDARVGGRVNDGSRTSPRCHHCLRWN